MKVLEGRGEPLAEHLPVICQLNKMKATNLMISILLSRFYCAQNRSTNIGFSWTKVEFE